jgi:hypothetical protein
MLRRYRLAGSLPAFLTQIPALKSGQAQGRAGNTELGESAETFEQRPVTESRLNGR